MVIVATDMLVQSFEHCLNAYRHLCSLFGVLYCAEYESNASVSEKAMVLAFAYPFDLIAVYTSN